jgi:hypothetical protein
VGNIVFGPVGMVCVSCQTVLNCVFAFTIVCDCREEKTGLVRRLQRWLRPGKKRSLQTGQ